MHIDAVIFDFLKSSMGFDSDAQLMTWLGISRDSLSGIRTGRLPMGDSIRFLILNKWWSEFRQRAVARVDSAACPENKGVHAEDMCSGFSAQSLLELIQSRLKDQGKAVTRVKGHSTLESNSVDAELLEAYKMFKGCVTDAEVANSLGIKRHSISMVRSGRNKLGPIPLLKIFEDVMGGDELVLQAAVQSSEALLKLITVEQGRQLSPSPLK